MVPNLQIPSPLRSAFYTPSQGEIVEFGIKREDLIHPEISGNKWRKLEPNIQQIISGKYEGIVTFGGAFSNHIYATAAAGRFYGFHTVGIIRGSIDDSNNSTLAFARQCGMNLYNIDRTAYRLKEKSATAAEIISKYLNHMILPEGGSNAAALMGCEIIGREINSQLPVGTDIFVAAGTGTTAAGIIRAIKNGHHIWVISALKGDFLKHEIQRLLPPAQDNWTLLTEYHRGGYGKVDTGLIDFINNFRKQTHIQLEPIYTAKAAIALLDLTQQGKLKTAQKPILIHTGGLQGINGHNYIASKRQRKDLIIH